jgi:hypothetical protein
VQKEEASRRRRPAGGEGRSLGIAGGEGRSTDLPRQRGGMRGSGRGVRSGTSGRSWGRWGADPAMYGSGRSLGDGGRSAGVRVSEGDDEVGEGVREREGGEVGERPRE